MDASTPQQRRAKGLSIGAAVLAALAASSCCIGPILLAALGLGGAGLFAGIAAYRPVAGRPDVYLKAIDTLGYEVTLASTPENPKAAR
jgi:hypothetical protein